MNRDITVSSIETGPYCVNTYFVRLNNSDECVIIDPADAGKVNTYLEKNGLGCNAILLTTAILTICWACRSCKSRA